MTDRTDRLTLLGVDFDSSIEYACQMKSSHHILKEYLDSKLHHSTPNEKQKERSVFVIGGGIIGIMASFYLCELGYQVTVIDRKTFGAAASARNGGGILALGRDLYDIPFIRLSISLWDDLTERGYDTKLLHSGHLMVAMNEYEMEKLKKAQVLYEAAGLDTVLLSSHEALAYLPDGSEQIQGALFSAIDSQGYPFTAMASLMDGLKRRGVMFIDDCEVQKFNIEHRRIRSVFTNRGEFTSDTFLLSAGPWTEQLGNMVDVKLPVMPRRSQIMATEIIEQRKIDPFVSGNGLYLRQTHMGNILYGGGGSWERNGFDVSNSIEAIQRLTGRFVEMFPNFKTVNLLRSFAGTVEITPDHFPLFGNVKPYDNLFVCAGFNGHGYGVAPIFGKLIANLIGDHHTMGGIPSPVEHVLKRFFPSRFSKDNEYNRMVE